MEERMVDDDFGKNEDFSVEIPDGAEDNYNENEVGLTPTQLAALEEERDVNRKRRKRRETSALHRADLRFRADISKRLRNILRRRFLTIPTA